MSSERSGPKKETKKRRVSVEPLQPLNQADQASLDSVFHKLLGRNKVAEIEQALNIPKPTAADLATVANLTAQIQPITEPQPLTVANLAEVVNLAEAAEIPRNETLVDQVDQEADLRSDTFTPVNLTTVANIEEAPQPMATVANLTEETEMATVAKTTTQAKTTTVVTVAAVKGELRIPNTIIDSLFPLLDTTAAMLYLRLYRLSHGYHKDTCTVGLEKLAKALNSGERTIQRAIDRLEGLGLIERQGAKFGGPIKGNVFKINLPATVDNMATQAKMATQANSTTDAKTSEAANLADNKDHDHEDLKRHDHHQSAHESETMTIYTSITGNSWTKADQRAYEQIKDLPIETIRQGIIETLKRAPQKPGSLAYFAKALLNPAQPNQAGYAARKAQMQAIVQQLKDKNFGRGYTLSQWADDTKEECARLGVQFDHDLFNECAK